MEGRCEASFKGGEASNSLDGRTELSGHIHELPELFELLRPKIHFLKLYVSFTVLEEGSRSQRGSRTHALF